MNIKFYVTQRSSDYHCCIHGHRENFGCGKTIAEAIGNAVRVIAKIHVKDETTAVYEISQPDEQERKS